MYREKSVREAILALALLGAMGALLLNPRLTSQAVVAGLELCGKRLLPSLFPFFVCSDLMVTLGLDRFPAKLLGKVMAPLFGQQPEGAAAVVLGAVGGYPSGAQAAARLYAQGAVSRREAEGLLRFCNNAGPAFVLGVVGAGVFGSLPLGAALYAIHITAAVLTGLLCKTGPARVADTAPLPQQQPPKFAAAFTASVRRAGETALTVCMFVVVFSVLSQFLLALLPVETPVLVRVGLGGLLELSNGMALLTAAALPLEVSFPLAAFLLGFGGLSVLAQTDAVVSTQGLALRGYGPAKLLQGLLSAVLALGFCQLFPLEPAALPAFAPLEAAAVQETGPHLPLVLAAIGLAGKILLIFRKLMGSNSKRNRV